MDDFEEGDWSPAGVHLHLHGRPGRGARLHLTDAAAAAGGYGAALAVRSDNHRRGRDGGALPSSNLNTWDYYREV